MRGAAGRVARVEVIEGREKRKLTEAVTVGRAPAAPGRGQEFGAGQGTCP